MKLKILAILYLISLAIASKSQSIEFNREKVSQAHQELKQTLEEFNKNLVSTDLEIAIAKLKGFNGGKLNPYHQYLVGGVLYEIDSNQSLYFHKQAYLANPRDVNFILEYALELHRKQSFEQAAELYEQYLMKEPEDYRIKALLADCQMNQNKIEQALQSWMSANHRSHHTGIDRAIHMVYGRTDQLQQRNSLIKQVQSGNLASLDELIYLDLNWQVDWWNSLIQEIFLKQDMNLAKKTLGAQSKPYKVLEVYTSLKQEPTLTKEVIQAKLKKANILIGNNPIPENGKIASGILQICFDKAVIDAKAFYKQRGSELLALAKQRNDVELLNIYAYLQARIEGKVHPQIDLLGWKEYKDERFAKSYLIAQPTEKCSGIVIKEAVADFPSSAAIYWFEADCAKSAGKDMKPYLIELIKKEFKTLNSDENRYSYRLNTYFMFLNDQL